MRGRFLYTEKMLYLEIILKMNSVKVMHAQTRFEISRQRPVK